MTKLSEGHLEQLCLDWFRAGGYDYVYGPDIAFDGDTPVRSDYQQVVLTGRLISTFKKIAVEITEKLRGSTSVDWQVRESVRAKLRNLVRRKLRKWKYPPDKQDDAVELVLKQAEVLCSGGPTTPTCCDRFSQANSRK